MQNCWNRDGEYMISNEDSFRSCSLFSGFLFFFRFLGPCLADVEKKRGPGNF